MFSANNSVFGQTGTSGNLTGQNSNQLFSFGNTFQNNSTTQNPIANAAPLFSTLPSSTTNTSVTNSLEKPLTNINNPSFTMSAPLIRQDNAIQGVAGAQNQTYSPLETLGASIPSEVQVVLSQLSNADSRSCQLLIDIFQRLRSLIADPPIFIAFTYEICSSSPLLAQKRAVLEEALSRLNKPLVLKTYNEAQKENPDSSLYAIVPVDGFSGIIERCQIQTRSFDQVGNLLQDLKARQELVRNHMEIQAMNRIQSIRQRHERLQSTVIDVVETLEDYAIANSVAQLDISFLRRLKSDISGLSAEVNQSAVGRLRLNQTMLTLKDISTAVGLDVRKFKSSQLSSEKPVLYSRAMIPDITDSSFKQIVRILQKQDILFDNLETSLRSLTFKSKKLLDILESSTEPVNRYAGTV